MKNQLVSIVIITYNSSKFVLETLNSISAQTYRNVELIISDDSSKDDTVAICKDWVNKNKERFTRAEIITSPENTGVVSNVNRAYQAVRGEWVKFLGGDDLLLPRFVESNLEIAKQFPNNSLITSKLAAFDSNSGRDLRIWPIVDIKNNDGPAQLKGLLKGNYIKTPSVFIRTDLVQKLGGFDTRYPMLEDGPFWIKANLAGYYFVMNPELLVRYRVHSESLSSSHKNFINPVFYPSYRKYIEEIVCPLLKREKMHASYLYKRVSLWIFRRVLKKGNDLYTLENTLERILFKSVNFLHGIIS